MHEWDGSSKYGMVETIIIQHILYFFCKLVLLGCLDVRNFSIVFSVLMGYTYLSLSSASFCPAGSEFMLRFPIIDRAYRYGLSCQLRLHGKEEFARNTFQAGLLRHDDRPLQPKSERCGQIGVEISNLDIKG